MNIEHLINKLTEYFSWLYYRQWQNWEKLTIAIAAIILLIWILRAHQKTKAQKRHEHDHSSIVGNKLVEHKTKH